MKRKVFTRFLKKLSIIASTILTICIVLVMAIVDVKATTDPTIADLWAGNAEWQHYYTQPYDVANVNTSWQSSQSTSIQVVNGNWYWFRRYMTPQRNIGVECLRSTDQGQTWTAPVAVLEPEPGTPWAWMVTDGDFFYDYDANKWRCLLQTIASPAGPWQNCYFERTGSDPMGKFSTPAGFTQPAISSKEIWSRIADNANDDCVTLAGGQLNAILDEGTIEIVQKVGDTFYITFHGAFIKNGKVHGVRGIATTTDFQNYTPAAPDCIMDENDADSWNVDWQGGNIGVGAQTCIKEGDYWYSMIEAADKDLGGEAGQNWTWGLLRSTSLTSTTWENWTQNPVTPFQPNKDIIEWCYAQLFKDNGTTYLAMNKSMPTSLTSTLFYKLVWKQATPTPSPSPTPTPVTTTLLSDDFGDGNANGWTSSDGNWSVESNEYSGTANSGQNSYALAGDSAWTDYTYQVKQKIMSGSNMNAGIAFRVQDLSNHYLFVVDTGWMALYKVENGVYTALASSGTSSTANTWYTFKAVVQGTSIKIYRNDVLQFNVIDNTFSSGKIGLRTNSTSHAHYDDVVVTATSTRLYNNDFNNGLAGGFISNDGNWVVRASEYSGTANVGYNSYALAGNSSWTDYTFQVRQKIKSGSNMNAGFAFRVKDLNNHYLLVVDTSWMALYKVQNGVYTLLSNSSIASAADTWHTFKTVVQGTSIKIYKNDVLLFDISDSTFSSGKIGLRTNSGTSALYDDIFVTADTFSPTLFNDFFSDGNSNGWTSNNGVWSVESNEYSGTANSGMQSYSLSVDNYSDFVYEVKTKIIDGNDAGIVFRAQDANNLYLLAIRTSGLSNTMELYKCVNGSYTWVDQFGQTNPSTFGNAKPAISPNTWYNVKIVANGVFIKVYLNDVLQIDTVDNTFSNGKVGLRCNNSTHAHFDNILVKGW